jgi:hypothetical protein
VSGEPELALGVAHALTRALTRVVELVSADPDDPGALTAASLDAIDGVADFVVRLTEGLAYRDAVAGCQAAGVEVPEVPGRAPTGAELADLVAAARVVARLAG